MLALLACMVNTSLVSQITAGLNRWPPWAECEANMTTETTFNVDATVDAIRQIHETRTSNAHGMPMAAWRMLDHAEKKLDRELEAYLKPVTSR